MAKSKNYEEQIRRRAKAGDIKKLKELNVKLAKSVNNKLIKIESAGLELKSVNYKKAVIELGETPRYGGARVIKGYSREMLRKRALQLNRKNQSKSLNTAELTKILEKYDKNVETVAKKYGLDPGMFKEFLRNGGGELLNNTPLDSEQVLDFLQQAQKESGKKKAGNRILKSFKKYMSISDKMKERVDIERYVESRGLKYLR